MNVASNARFLGEFKLFASSDGGSTAVSLTVSKSKIRRLTILKYEKYKIREENSYRIRCYLFCRRTIYHRLSQ